MNVKYYSGLLISPASEIPATEAASRAIHTKAYSDGSGKLDRTETYSNGRLVKVTYFHSSSMANVKTFHLQNYSDAPFTIWQSLAELRGLTWEFAYSFDPAGELQELSKTLTDEDQRQLWQIEMDEHGKILQSTKYYWEEGKLRYVFEYDEEGVLTNIYDSLYSDHVLFQDLEDSLPDATFYEAGSNLPQALAGSAIPPNPS